MCRFGLVTNLFPFPLVPTPNTLIGDVIQGAISIRPNAKNHRDLDIDFELEWGGENASSDRLSYKMA
ncbi:hypothetical protein O181_105554 [Austropuccinia psidii MF-1]|uniref:Uncharacterized protein n=1 Tax=Austropuccinia psidii MF-1 TaxID=1389203 RepID=A0A9Q3JQD7_9BASI|nr:hypothetical protein [Austropuccinia psidii MF-1]